MQVNDIAARRDAILAETQADWDEFRRFERDGVTREARAEAEAAELASRVTPSPEMRAAVLAAWAQDGVEQYADGIAYRVLGPGA